MNISLLQWNIWIHEKPENVLSLIKQLNPDIICLQELTQNFDSTGNIDVSAFLSQSLGYNYYYAQAHSWPGVKGERNQGNGIFTRFPIKTKTYKFVQPIAQTGSHGYANEGRVLAIAELEINHSLVTIGTTHLSYTDRFEETLAKITEENNLLEALKVVNNKLIITGDFNTSEKSYLVQAMEKKYKHAGPAYVEKTWTTKPFYYNGFDEDKLNWRLDYVFTTHDITVTNSEIIQTEFSDHLPILTTFDF